jgi:hypothetical protein
MFHPYIHTSIKQLDTMSSSTLPHPSHVEVAVTAAPMSASSLPQPCIEVGIVVAAGPNQSPHHRRRYRSLVEVAVAAAPMSASSSALLQPISRSASSLQPCAKVGIVAPQDKGTTLEQGRRHPRRLGGVKRNTYLQ